MEQLKQPSAYGVTSGVIAAFVERYGPQPRGQPLSHVKLAHPLPRGHERVLQDVIGFIRIADIPADKLVCGGLVPSHDLAESGAVSIPSGARERAVRILSILRHGALESSAFAIA